MRVLGIAYAPSGLATDADGQEADLIWLGLVGMSDPIRSGAPQSIKAFHRAGMETVMITGDQSATAYSVGKELGLSNGNALKILESTDLAQANSDSQKALVKNVHVFARVSPSDKLQIVQALQSAGKIVAMTGDGINDGPALKAADIGIAMGAGGADVAREVADVVLEEDNLESLIIAMSHGRTIYNNIRKTLRFLLATNFSEILLMFITGATGLGYPLNAMQLLWINLISDVFPGLALALEAPEPDVLERPPRNPDELIVGKEDFKQITFEASTITVASLISYGYGYLKYGNGPASGTLAFQSLTTAQILHALTCRSEEHSIYESSSLPRNKYLETATLGSLGLQVLSQLVPGLRSLLGTTRLSLFDTLVVAGASIIPLLINDAAKSQFHKETDREDTPAPVELL
jgi:Ca2+-transporting ATPase